MVACDQHRNRKKGSCQACQLCRLCDPPSYCLNKQLHIKSYKEKRIKKRRKLSHEPSAKAQIANIFDILGIPQKPCLDNFPAHGYSQELMLKDERRLRKGKQIINLINEQLCQLISPSNPEFSSKMKIPNLSNNSTSGDLAHAKELVAKTTQLALLGKSTSSSVAQSLLAKSFQRQECSEILREEYNKLDLESREKIPAKSILMSHTKFSVLRKAYSTFFPNEECPKIEKEESNIVAAINFLQQHLVLKADTKREINIVGIKCFDMPLYDYGGKSLPDLISSYIAAFDSKSRVEIDVVKVIIASMTTDMESTVL